MSDSAAQVQELAAAADKLKNEGKTAEAIAKFEELLALDDTHLRSHLTLAVLYHRELKYEDAIRHAVRACELGPSDPYNFTVLSATYQRAWAHLRDQNLVRLAEDAMARANMLQQQQRR